MHPGEGREDVQDTSGPAQWNPIYVHLLSGCTLHAVQLKTVRLGEHSLRQQRPMRHASGDDNNDDDDDDDGLIICSYAHFKGYDSLKATGWHTEDSMHYWAVWSYESSS